MNNSPSRGLRGICALFQDIYTCRLIRIVSITGEWLSHESTRQRRLLIGSWCGESYLPLTLLSPSCRQPRSYRLSNFYHIFEQHIDPTYYYYFDYVRLPR